MKIELYHTTCELKTWFRNEKDPRLAARIRAVYLGLMGKTAPDIATLLGYSRRAIQTWIQAYNQKGIEGLRDRPGRGTPCRLNPDQLQWLRQRLDEGPGPDAGISVFHGRDIQRMIRQRFGVKYRLSAIYTLLKRLGYSYVSSRPEHPKGNPQARQDFKKKSVIRSGNSVMIILE
jgi:transposase